MTSQPFGSEPDEDKEYRLYNDGYDRGFKDALAAYKAELVEKIRALRPPIIMDEITTILANKFIDACIQLIEEG